MQSNKIKTRFCVLAAGTAIISFAVPQAAQAASPPFAYTEEKWDSCGIINWNMMRLAI